MIVLFGVLLLAITCVVVGATRIGTSGFVESGAYVLGCFVLLVLTPVLLAAAFVIGAILGWYYAMG